MRIFVSLKLTLHFLLMAMPCAAEETSAVSEVRLLGAFTLSVVKFTHWQGKPELAMAGSKLRVDIVDNRALFGVVKQMALGKSFENHELDVSELGYNDLAALSKNKAKCPEVIVFIPENSDAEQKKYFSYLEKLKGCNCLTVTYDAGKSASDAIVNFYKKDEHLRFEVSIKRAQEEKLELSSQLLKLATPSG